MATNKPTPKPTAKKKAVFVMPDGSTVGQKDIGKVKPTPKPGKAYMNPPKSTKMTPQDKAMAKILEKKYGMKFGSK